MSGATTRIVVFAAFVCLIGGFGFAIWNASKHQQSWNHAAHYHERQAAQRTQGDTTIQINCDPNCSAEEPGESRYGGIGKFVLRFISDPLAVATLLLVGVVMFQIRDARFSSERQLRAYVLIKRVEFHRPNTTTADEDEWPIHVACENSGQTPAYNVVVTAERYLGAAKPIDDIFALSAAAQISPQSIIAPGFPHLMRLGGIEPGRSKFFKAQEADMRCYVWGRIDYTDTFGRRHFTKFQMWHGFIAINQFGFCQAGNVTDDEFPERWWIRLLKLSHRAGVS